MNISKVQIKNFRLLRDTELCFAKNSTVIVGRNNSGKTSLTELFKRIFIDDTPKFKLEDFSLGAHNDFIEAAKLFRNEEELNIVREKLPLIELRIHLNYAEDQDDFSSLKGLIIDLDPETTETIIVVRYQLTEGKMETLFKDLNPTEVDFDSVKFFKEIQDRLSKTYSISAYVEDPSNENNTSELKLTQLQAAIQGNIISAQRGLDDVTTYDKGVLSHVIEALFTAALSETAKEDDKSLALKVTTHLNELEGDLSKEFAQFVKDLVPQFEFFGFPGLNNTTELSTETSLDPTALLKKFTKITYSTGGDITLPESYNGLGTRNLIFILLRLYEFYKSYVSKETQSGMHLIFIEEPEAHLHPQMQEVFIKKLDEIATKFSKTYGDEKQWPVQFIVTTHSSHLANAAQFDATRYFTSTLDGNKDRTTTIKDLSIGLKDIDPKDKGFLQKYMTLTRCDLMFADKAILIEGTSERLLLPEMIKKHDAPRPQENKLGSQYISIVEVGGAYAHKFFRLVEFLELPTLIITDIDTVAVKEGKVQASACKVSIGEKTSNGCIKDWFTKTITPPELLLKSEEDKTRELLRLSYQIPDDTAICGRSFEDAFILKNPSLFELEATPQEELEQAVWDEAKTWANKKSEFALKHAIDNTDWNTPKYIQEGLVWLADTPNLASIDTGSCDGGIE